MVYCILFMVVSVFLGCQRLPSAAPVVMSRTTLESDSLVSRLFSLLAQERREVHRDSFIMMSKYIERTVVNENGDTTRHDTHTEITTAQYQALRNENSILIARIDSLEKVRNRVDTVPVPVEVRMPYPVERELSAWERFRLWAFWPLAALALAAGFAWVWLRRKDP